MTERDTHPTPPQLKALQHGDVQHWKELFFELGTVGCVVADPRTLRLLRANRRFASMLGYQPDELVDTDWFSLNHPGDRSSDSSLYEQLMRGQRSSYPLRKRLLHREGHAVHTNIEVRALRDGAGEVALLAATVHDISEDVHRVEELERERLRYMLLSNATRAITRNAARGELGAELAAAIRATLGERAVAVEVWEPEAPSSATVGTDAEARAALRELLGPWVSQRSERDEPPSSRPTGTGLVVDAGLGGAHATLAAWGAHRAVGHVVSVDGHAAGALLVALTARAPDGSLDLALGEVAAELGFALARREVELERARIASELALAVHALEASPVVLYRAKLEPGYPLTYLSSNAARYGFDVNALLSGEVPFAELIHPDDAARITAEAKEMIGSGRREATQRYRLRSQDGKTLEVEDSFRIVEAEDPGSFVLEGVLRDISAQLEGERAIAASEAKFRKLFDLSPQPMWVFDVETLRFLEVNRAAVEHYGYTREEFLARTILDIRPADEEARVRAAVGKRPEGFDRVGVWRHLKRDGTSIDVEITSHVLDFDGRRAELVLANDVTGREAAELRARNAIAELERTLLATVDAVARMVEVRDPYTAGHERRVSELSVAFGRAMGLDEQRLEGLRIGGYVHDVGKIAVPAEILAKPTRLSKMEFEIIKAHAERGYAILQPISFPWPVAEMARQHHERIDGSGYPQGLRGDAILLEARILAVADVVESMASDRPYRPGLGLAAALDEIEKNRGRLYDPDVADACLGLFRSGALELPR